MAFKYTEEQLNKLDKELLVHLFLGLQEQMDDLTKQTQALNDKMQLMMEQRLSAIWMLLNRKTLKPDLQSRGSKRAKRNRICQVLKQTGLTIT